MGKLAKAIGNIRLPFIVVPIIIGIAGGIEIFKYTYKLFKD